MIFLFFSHVSTFFSLSLCYILAIWERKEVFILKKLGTVTVSVFKTDNNNTDFCIETDNDSVLPVSYVIEDTLKLY